MKGDRHKAPFRLHLGIQVSGISDSVPFLGGVVNYLHGNTVVYLILFHIFQLYFH